MPSSPCTFSEHLVWLPGFILERIQTWSAGMNQLPVSTPCKVHSLQSWFSPCPSSGCPSAICPHVHPGRGPAGGGPRRPELWSQQLKPGDI